MSRSTAMRDRGIKRERYALFGVPEYWVVDVDAGRVEVFRLQEDAGHPRVVTDRLEWQPVGDGPVLDLNVSELSGSLG